MISGAAMVAAPPRTPRRRARSGGFLSDFRDLKPGDPVVHTDHGVGRFIRMTRLGEGESAPELVEIHYAKGGKLFLPVDRLDLLEKYSAGSASASAAARPVGGHELGPAAEARRESHARHRRANSSASTRPAGGPPATRFHAMSRGWRTSRTPSNGPRPRTRRGRFATCSRIWSPRCRWTGCSRATSASGRRR